VLTRAMTRANRLNVGSSRFTLETVYVFIITAFAIAGMTAQGARLLLVLAALLALPCGIAAIVGLYVLTGLFNWVAAGFSTYSFSRTTGGCDTSGHCWTHTTGTPVGARGFFFDTCVVLLFVTAALINVVILRSIAPARCADERPSSGAANPDS